MLTRTTARAHRGEQWSIPAEDVSYLEEIVSLYDYYLATLPAHRFMSARGRLQRFLASKSASPVAAEGALGNFQ